jgi:hypothetical protein
VKLILELMRQQHREQLCNVPRTGAEFIRVSEHLICYPFEHGDEQTGLGAEGLEHHRLRHANLGSDVRDTGSVVVGYRKLPAAAFRIVSRRASASSRKLATGGDGIKRLPRSGGGRSRRAYLVRSG